MMKRVISVIVLIVLMAIGLCACAQTQVGLNAKQSNQSQENNDVKKSSLREEAIPNKALVVYFSWSGNTRALAKEISTQTGADLFEIRPVEPYSEDYNATAERWHKERDSDARPAIVGMVNNMDSYQTIFVGYPIWSSDVPAVVRTFLEQYNLSGKTIVPFCTHGGSGFGNSINRIKTLCPNSKIASGFEVKGDQVNNSADAVGNWLSNLGIVHK